MLKRALILFTLCLLTLAHLSAQQRREFTQDPKVFINELKDFFSPDQRPEVKAAIDQFSKLWIANSFSKEEQDKIMDLCNTMLRQRLKISPEFTTYVTLLNGYKTNNLDIEKFNKFHEVADQLLTKSKKDFQEFAQTCQYLFTDKIIFKNQAKTWQVISDKYSLDFEKEPVLTFTKVDLFQYTKGDTMSISETSGKYYINSNKWNGKGGTVYWTRVGFTKEKAFAKLGKYKINVQNSDYQADSVQFSFPQSFPKPILGRLQDKASTDNLGIKSSYPRFRSYQNILSLKNIFKDVDFDGGFALEGQEILGTGVDSNRATVTIKQNGKIVMRALSKTFVIAPDKISASKAAVSFYLDKDSLSHTQVYFSYQEKTRTLTLSRDNIGLYSSPFFNSYHQLEFKSGNISWDIDSSRIYMKDIANPGTAMPFESASFFAEEKYRQIQTILDYNPLAKLKRMTDDYKSRILSETDLAGVFGNKIENLRQMLLQLANDGYIFYDIGGHQIIVKDKLIHYVIAAEKNGDYDIIRFQSTIFAKPNAYIDLKTLEMTVEGIPRINVSDSQSTYFLPKEQTVVFKKNRDMVFAGQVHSGRFDFYGNNFVFDYDKFNVVFKNIDSVKFKFPEYDSLHRFRRLRTIQNTIEKVTGFLYIDDPSNKSGKKPLDKYPIFDCKTESYVYYEKDQIYNKVYPRKTFFFKINPFVIDSLDKFTAEGLQFPGTFTSADIIPVIQNALTIQEDFSLGFKTNAPDKGFPLYKGKGTAKGLFSLSSKGLRSNGSLDYLVSKTTSKEFVYFPDSMNSFTQTFDIPEIAGGKYPPMTGKGTFDHWRPYKDSMYIYKVKDPITVYNGKIKFSGSFILTPVELVGSGAMAYQNLNINAEAFAFLPQNIKTKSGDLSIKSELGNRAALKASNINADIDLTKDFGSFRTNVDTTKIDLPTNRFSTTLNTFTYDITKKQVDFVKSTDQSTDDAYFISSNQEQDNLKFKSAKASFNLTTQSIKAEDVPYMLIADSKIFAPKNMIMIEKEGNIGAIKEADIVTDDKTGYHKIYNASVNIFGQNKFTGTGNYDYLDKDKKVFKIAFSDIRVNDKGKTVATGTIAAKDKFYLSPKLKYYGGVSLLSDRKELEFEGLVQPEHPNKALGTQYVKISQIIDPANVVLEIPTPLNKDDQSLYTGTFISYDSSKIYNLLFGKKLSADDHPIFTATGVFYLDEKNNEFVYGPRNKLIPATKEDEELEGNVFTYNLDSLSIYSEGLYELGVKYKHIDFHTAGTYKYSYKRNSNAFSLVMLINFPFGDETAKMMTDSITFNSKFAADVDNSQKGTLMAYSTLINNKKEKEKALQDITTNHIIPQIDDLNKTFVFSLVKLRYVDSTASFLSFGTLGLANFKKTIINKSIDGVLEIKRDKPADRMSMLLISNPGSFHYFSYQDGNMSYQSSDLTYTDKTAQTASKVEKGKKGYRLKLGSIRDVQTLYGYKSAQ